MSKTRAIKFEVYDNYECSLNNIVTLLRKAGWSITDSHDRVNIYDVNNDDEWGTFSGTYEEFLQSDNYKRLIEIYYSDGQTANIWIENKHSFIIYPSSYIKMTNSGDKEFFDFNWY